MNSRFRILLTAALIVVSTSMARAEIVIHEIGSTAANTLTALGRNFLMACAILAVGIVVAAFISKKK